jgi:predicted  nucleic acid-binding Zn-ribbon protein
MLKRRIEQLEEKLEVLMKERKDTWQYIHDLRTDLEKQINTRKYYGTKEALEKLSEEIKAELTKKTLTTKGMN